MTLDWRRLVVYSHRWLGIAGSILFAAWFVSGIVMMYARMPHLTPEERLARAAVLDLRAATIAPASAAGRLGGAIERLRVGMLLDRPVYRLHDGRRWSVVFADDGAALGALDPDRALAIASAYAPASAPSMRYAGRLTEPDQWTLQLRALFPLHRVDVGDAAASTVYVSEPSGEIVLATTRRTRWGGYLGAVIHWIYFTPVRRHGEIWAQLIIWTSIAGSIACLLGVIWGVWRYSPSSRYRLRRRHAHSPYAGWMRWHHYAGLIFGVTTLTWVFSGLLSMNPWSWSPSTGPSVQQRHAVAGGALAVQELTLERLRAAHDVLAAAWDVKEIELLQFDGSLYAEAYRATLRNHAAARFAEPGAVVAPRLPLEHRVVDVRSPEAGAFDAFDRGRLLAAAERAMPDVRTAEVTWLDRYDAYYYDRSGSLPLPVLRVRYDDGARTWLYLDPRRGEIVRREERLTRINRWLYHGLHSLDFPWVYWQRPLWDIIVIAFSVGGLVLSLTSAPAGWRRLRRHGRRVRASFRSSSA